MEKKKEISMPESVEEKADLEYQVNDQIRLFRMAWNMGDLMAVSRAGTMWFNLLASNMTKEEREDFKKDSMPLEKISNYVEFFTEDDKQDIKDYGEIETDRKKELVREAIRKNSGLFNKSWSKKAVTLFKIMNRIGIGFTKQTSEDI